MYDSAPTAREGERIEALAPEAIDATANSANHGSSRRSATSGAGSQQRTIRLLATLVIVEAVALIAVLLMWAL